MLPIDFIHFVMVCLEINERNEYVKKGFLLLFFMMFVAKQEFLTLKRVDKELVLRVKKLKQSQSSYLNQLL